MRRLLILFSLGLLFTILIGCTNDEPIPSSNDAEPESEDIESPNNESDEVNILHANNILDHVLTGDYSNEPFYGEGSFVFDLSAESQVDLIFKEWYGTDGDIRYELTDVDTNVRTIAVMDSDTVLLFNESNNMAGTDSREDAHEISVQPMKEETLGLLQMIRYTDKYTIEIFVDSDDGTYYLKAIDVNDFIYEMWINKADYSITKIVVLDDLGTSEVHYTTVDVNARVSDDMFTLDLPDDVTIIDYEEVEGEDLINEITLSEAVEELETNFLYVPEANGMDLDGTILNLFEVGEDDEEIDIYKEIELIYSTDDYLSMMLSVDRYEHSFAAGTTLLDETLTIRNVEGEYVDNDLYRMVQWQEDGLNYSITIFDDTISIDDVVELAETMEFVE